VFSPYYARARRRGAGDPLDHCALNVALYGERGKRWALTERGRGALERSATSLAIGPSRLVWDGDALTVRIDELTVPVPSRIRGVVRVRPSALPGRTFALDAAGAHRWSPIAPCARVEVALERPALAWTGAGYLDCNAGDEPLEDGFSRWDWSRASLRGGDTAVLYDARRRGGDPLFLGLRFAPSGRVEDFYPPPQVTLPLPLWRVARGTRSEIGHPATVLRTLEDAPFYTRSLVASRLLGESVTAVHESLSLDRFRAGWVRLLLPFRMPRVAG
jgi:carotenoid 1,2-hydratase